MRVEREVIGERWIGTVVGDGLDAPVVPVLALAPATAPPVLLARAGVAALARTDAAPARTVAALARTDKLP